MFPVTYRGGEGRGGEGRGGGRGGERGAGEGMGEERRGVKGGVGEDKTGGMWRRGEGWMNPYIP